MPPARLGGVGEQVVGYLWGLGLGELLPLLLLLPLPLQLQLPPLLRPLCRYPPPH